jgi:mRNA interferase MazF
VNAVPASRQGDVWEARPEPVVGHEQGGTRPVLVVSVDRISAGPGELCIVVPFTRTNRDTPLHVRVEPPEGGLTSVSFALCENVRAISRERLAERLGGVRDATLEAVLHRIHLLTRKPQ